MKLDTDIHGPWRMNLFDFGDPPFILHHHKFTFVILSEMTDSHDICWMDFHAIW